VKGIKNCAYKQDEKLLLVTVSPGICTMFRLNTKDKTYLSKTLDFSNRLPIKACLMTYSAVAGLKAAWNFYYWEQFCHLHKVISKFAI